MPGRCGDAGGRPGRVRGHRRVHHGAPVVTHDLARSAGNGLPPPLARSGPPGPPAPAGGPAGRRAARQALSKAVSHLTALQHPDGWWQGELETNVTMDAEDLLLREFLGIRTAEETEAAARWIR